MHGGVGGGYEYLHQDRVYSSIGEFLIVGLYVVMFIAMAIENLWGG